MPKKLNRIITNMSESDLHRLAVLETLRAFEAMIRDITNNGNDILLSIIQKELEQLERSLTKC